MFGTRSHFRSGVYFLPRSRRRPSERALANIFHIYASFSYSWAHGLRIWPLPSEYQKLARLMFYGGCTCRNENLVGARTLPAKKSKYMRHTHTYSTLINFSRRASGCETHGANSLSRLLQVSNQPFLLSIQKEVDALALRAKSLPRYRRILLNAQKCCG